MVLDDFELIAGDRLHPSGKMYAMWVEEVLPAAREILSQ
jgi:lysophospholipase L1-like esterase